MRSATWRVSVVLATCVLAPACSPALDWREVRLDEAGLVALFPCKVSRHVRSVSLAGQAVTMTQLACKADGATYALAHADVEAPAQVGAALDALVAALLANVDGRSDRRLPFELPGMTPSASATRTSIQGRLPDGTPAQIDVAVFAKGTRVVQATVASERPGDAAGAQTFFAELRLR